MITEIRTKRTNPRVYYTYNVLKNIDVQKKALKLAIDTLGLITLKVTNRTGFQDDDKTLFAHYDIKNNAIIISTQEEQQGQNGADINNQLNK